MNIPFAAVARNREQEEYMRKILYVSALILASYITPATANVLVNPGFENGWQGWVRIDPKKNALAISNKGLNGLGAAKITSSDGYFVQSIKVNKNTNYELRVNVLGAGILGAKVEKSLFVERSKKSRKWKEIVVKFNTSNDDEITVFAQINGGKKTIFDDFSLVSVGGAPIVNTSAIKLGKGGLSPDLPPGKNFELIDWYLSIPVDKDRNGKSDQVFETQLANGFTDKKYFYTGEDGGMVFKAPIGGAKTSKKSNYTKTQLREMLRRGNLNISVKSDGLITTKNNWVLSTAPGFTQKAAGGVDGALFATLAVNRVTVTGSKSHVGRIIIGQIGAQSNSPVRLYYRKLPQHKKGSFYVKHEVLGGSEEKYFDIVGSRSYSADEPENGIALNEKFSFEIIASGHAATVTVKKDGKKLGAAKIYLTQGGYDSRETYLYYQVGVSNQNNSGDDDDYAQVTYYELENTHVGYDY